MGLEVEVGVVFAGGWEVVVGEVGEEALELEEEAFAWEVAVGVHVELSGEAGGEGQEGVEGAWFEEGGGGDGDGFVSCGEECPAVGGAFGDVEGVAFVEAVEDGEVVDGAAGAGGEAEARLRRWFQDAGFRFQVTGILTLGSRVEVAVLDAEETAVGVVVGDLEPVDALAVAPGGEAAPADDAWVEAAGVEKEVAGFGGEVGAVEEVGVAGGVEGGLG